MTSCRRAAYEDRPLSAGFPDLEAASTGALSEIIDRGSGYRERVEYVLSLVGRVIDLQPAQKIAVIGCGPRPETVRILDEIGYDVTGIEPVADYVDAAVAFLEGRGTVLVGAAEELPLANGSQNVVLFESVLEHVDSPIKTLNEAYRVLAAGGVAYVVTTNRLRFSPSGASGEFNVRFYNWLPRLVRESYVFEQLHFKPELANFTPRPAVHWFTYADLCELGREASFAQFYSHLDLLRPGDATVESRRWKRRLLERVQASPWLRALALTQVGGTVIMWKRPA